MDDENKENKPTKKNILALSSLALAVMCFGSFVALLVREPLPKGDAERDLLGIIAKLESPFISFPLTLAVGSLAFLSLSLLQKNVKNKGPSNFIDIDNLESNVLKKLSSELDASNKQKIEQTIEQRLEAKLLERILPEYSFPAYFSTMRSALDKQISNSDQKGSLLLDKGTNYARAGIIFYLVSIVAWQVALLGQDIKPQHIYGIVGCSLLFIFIEFLSAWFLKQYRQYVDTSTYLIKVKSTLERYILAYFAIHDASKGGVDYSNVVSMLSEEIKWPQSYLTKSPEIGFAKECLETSTQLIRSLRGEPKPEGQ